MDTKKIKTEMARVNAGMHYFEFTQRLKAAVENALIYMFPGYFNDFSNEARTVEELRAKMECDFKQLMGYVYDDPQEAEEKLAKLFDKLPEVYETILTDIGAAYEGDPAAKNFDEIVLCYPAFRTISAYRIAHELYKLDVPIIPRAITEYEHRLTGIDIHPGATIGKHFFIDHGTGVVIGETAVIGNHVKLYQHVTLGAKSFPVNEDGTLVKGNKRHPNLGDNVVVYAGATILGDVTIGENCVIGGNVWLMHSVESHHMVSMGKVKTSIVKKD